MKLQSVRVTNLRCLEEVQFSPRSYTCLIGPNNSGKSSLLRALQIILDQDKPSIDEWRKGAEDKPITIEVVFGNLTDWEKKVPGVAGLVYNDLIQLRMVCTAVNDEKKGGRKVEAAFYSYRVQESFDGWPEGATFTKLSNDFQSIATEIGISTKNFKQTNSQESLRTEIRKRYPQRVTAGSAGWTEDGVSIPSALKQALPQVHLIPAVRDAAADAKFGANTSFGLLIKSIILPAIRESSEYSNLLDAAAQLGKKMRGDGTEKIAAIGQLEQQITDRISELISAKVSFNMEMPDGEKFVGTNTSLQLDDGLNNRIDLQGHGLQRSLIFALIEVLALQGARIDEGQDEQVKNRCTVLLFEEPELFIHPHLLRRLKGALSAISRKGDWQVVVSTHSPFLVDVGNDPQSLVIHHRVSGSSSPHLLQLTHDPFKEGEQEDERERLRAVIDFHPTVCEAFFARHVVLVEGDTELAALGLIKTLGVLPEELAKGVVDVSIVSCDGKWTIIPMARILRSFGVPVRVIHDKDLKGRDEATAKANGSDEFNANERIAAIVGSGNVFVVDDTFEHLLWLPNEAPVSKNDKPFRAWKRIKDMCSGKCNLNESPELKRLVEFAFAMSVA